MIKIEQLVSYPLKSGSGVTAESLTGGASGIDGDREFVSIARAIISSSL